MLYKLKCPTCDYKLQNVFILVFQMQNIGDERLPCPNCNYELIDRSRLKPWIIKAILVGTPVAFVTGSSSKGLYYIIPVILIVWFLTAMTMPLKPTIKHKK